MLFLLCVLEVPPCTPIHPISGKKNTNRALRSITQSLKNQYNCHSNCSDRKLPDTLLKTFLLKKTYLATSSIPWCFPSLPPFLSPVCTSSNIATSHPWPTTRIRVGQGCWAAHLAQALQQTAKGTLSCLPSPKKQTPSCLGDTQLVQVRIL